VACDRAVGHRFFGFRWLTLKWVMDRYASPGTVSNFDWWSYSYDPQWRRFDFETWRTNPERNDTDPDIDDPKDHDPNDPGDRRV
jgi:hypothetical protein